MVGKRVLFDDETRQSFQELTDEAFYDLLKKHKRPVGFEAALKKSVSARKKHKR